MNEYLHTENLACSDTLVTPVSLIARIPVPTSLNDATEFEIQRNNFEI
jgi:hypothetical protein